MKSIFKYSAFIALALALNACTSEYGPSEIEVSDQGAFVERDTGDLVDGVFKVEKQTGELLTVEFENGIPRGLVQMQGADGSIILKSSFMPKTVQKVKQGYGLSFVNNALENGAGSMSTRDYVELLEEFADYDGNYFSLGSNKKSAEGVYDKGQRVGRWLSRCENEQLESDRTYVRLDGGDGDKLSKIDKELVYTCDGDLLLSAVRDEQGLLQGEYIENQKHGAYGGGDKSAKPLAKYLRNYLDGELEGPQKEYDRYGLLKYQNNYKNGVKQGVENVFSSGQDYQTKENTHWLSEVKNYSNGQRNGQYKRYDKLGRMIESGQYVDDQPSGLWTESNFTRYKKSFVDYDESSFLLDKAKAFKEACFLPVSSWSSIDWSSLRQGNLASCEYYVEKAVVDLNKKLALDLRAGGDFQKSSDWTYAAVVAAPDAYSYMKKHGLKTNVADSQGRNRLNICLQQMRLQQPRYMRCNVEQALGYVADVDVDQVSNFGAALHQIASERTFLSRKPDAVKAELQIARALITKGANINQLDYKQRTAFMLALSSANYDVAEILLDAGASIGGVDVNGQTTFAHLFIDANNRWRTSEIAADGVRVLAKMIALGLDTGELILGDKTAQELIEENNTIHHLQSIKDAQAMSLEFKGTFSNRTPDSGIEQEAVLENGLTDEPEDPERALFESVAAEPSESMVADEEYLVEGAGEGLAEEADDNIDAGAEESIVAENESEVTSVVSPIATDGVNGLNTEIKAAELDVKTNPSILEEQVAPFEEPQAQALTETDLPQNQQDSALKAQSDVEALLKGQADFLVQQANEHIASYRLKTPKTNSALGSLNQLKKIDPENINIALIERQIGQKYFDLAISKAKQGNKAAAQKHMESAKQFVSDPAIITKYQSRVDSTRAAAKKTATKKSSRRNKALVCEPNVKAIGIAVLGRTLIARQSMELSKQHMLKRSLTFIKKDYQNIVTKNNIITFEQSTKGKPIKFKLDVRSDGDNNQLSVSAKAPAGYVIKKADYRSSFCDLLKTF